MEKIYNDIRTKALDATEGPWFHQPYGGQNQNGDYSGGSIFDATGEYLVSEIGDDDGAYIAAVSPDRILTLLAEHEALGEWAEVQEDAITYGRFHLGECEKLRDKLAAQMFAAREALEAGKPDLALKLLDESEPARLLRLRQKSVIVRTVAERFVTEGASKDALIAYAVRLMNGKEDNDDRLHIV